MEMSKTYYKKYPFNMYLRRDVSALFRMAGGRMQILKYNSIIG